MNVAAEAVDALDRVEWNEGLLRVAAAARAIAADAFALARA